MAYLDFAEAGGAATLDRGASFAPKGFTKPVGLTSLEWQVVALAQRDKLASIRPAGVFTRAIRWAVGVRVSNALSDTRLEALRRIAVLSWYRGFAVAPAEVRSFLAAGFSLDHYEILLAHINAARAVLPRRFRRRI